MALKDTVLAGLHTFFDAAAKAVGMKDLSTEQAMRLSVGYETKDLNAFSRKHGLRIKVAEKGVGIDGLPETTLRMLVHVTQKDSYPVDRKIVVDFDLTSRETVDVALVKLKSTFFQEVGKMKPSVLPVLTLDAELK